MLSRCSVQCGVPGLGIDNEDNTNKNNKCWFFWREGQAHLLLKTWSNAGGCCCKPTNHTTEEDRGHCGQTYDGSLLGWHFPCRVGWIWPQRKPCSVLSRRDAFQQVVVRMGKLVETVGRKERRRKKERRRRTNVKSLAECRGVKMRISLHF